MKNKVVQGWQMVPVDALAAYIRQIDGNNSMGAGTLAENICEWLAAAPQPSDDAKDVLLSVLTDIANTDLSGADDSVVRFIFVALQHRAKAAIDAAMAGGWE